MRQRKLAYARVSSRDQNENRQIDAFLKAGVKPKNIYVDKQSGKDFDRPKYNELIKKLRESDVLFIKSIDRLGRNYTEIIDQWKYITKTIKADVVVLDMPLLDTRVAKNLLGTFISDLVLQILSFVAETERNNIKRRQKEGIVAAKKRGVRFGRPKTALPSNFKVVCTLLRNNECTIAEAANKCNMSKTTFYNKAKQAGEI
ncbi:recombinase family protein [Butyrivibrio sp. YAB3001]|uniref:recombinase family protein n=1 Tax=Butyrivibrio sp. YAB3001 TaxID=1520812 RepID=UPI0008F61F8D|nr:recombinase family protein [Butyrivibrio sp. YAB3001]SFC80536.1 Site-specific DNA recombinase [Butyrivibrio sp. YAB3001]